MASRNTRRVVVIKDIPSNMIEEAILILKNDIGIKTNVRKMNTSPKNKKKRDDYIIKEAESIINSFINESKTAGLGKGEAGLGLNPPKRGFWINTVINLALVGSIALFIFLISRMV